MATLIFYLVTERYSDTITAYLGERGRHWRREIVPIYYESLAKMESLPVGTYVFSDLDRLTRAQRKIAAGIYEALSTSRPKLKLLNNPAKFKDRFTLLRELFDRDINVYKVYRPDEIADVRSFPVFVRFENDHRGPRTPLLEDRGQLDRAITELILAGANPDELMIVEFCDLSDSAGVFRKYSVWRLGDRYMARHLSLGKNWMQKAPVIGKSESYSQAWLDEEASFLEDNPHLDQIKPIFEMANIDYGRVDYGIRSGKVQVWEINSNPGLITANAKELPERLHINDMMEGRFTDLWTAINSDEAPKPGIPIEVSFKGIRIGTSI